MRARIGADADAEPRAAQIVMSQGFTGKPMANYGDILDENSIVFVLSARGVKAKNLSVAICDVYVKVNLPPSLFEVDLLHEIDPEHPKTRCRVSPDQVAVTLQKRSPRIWGEFRAAGAKAELRERRAQALQALELREAERLQKRQAPKARRKRRSRRAQKPDRATDLLK
ncbi:unnamed protein product [Effrenium voratum]|uniref:Uncharacterized protein n=1 Tax=Effrenium voratum TaxID=2562239 RepID=A0AA36HUN5_9DINO|nr:unnamed protein product [Effrenium voratum]